MTPLMFYISERKAYGETMSKIFEEELSNDYMVSAGNIWEGDGVLKMRR